MELKRFQKKALAGLRGYARELQQYPSEKAASVAFMVQADAPYTWAPELGRSPFVCIKVPTGGGKTFIAAHSVGIIFEEYLKERGDRGLVMWFVPSDAIKVQTLKNLTNRKHPYREALDKRFHNAVRVFELGEAKAIKKDDLANNLCIVVSTLSAFRRTDKEWLKAYQDNGALMNHFEDLATEKFGFLEHDKDGELVYSLGNVIRLHNPFVIADEGHNVQTGLAMDMLKGLNPAFVLEFTATPRERSNVLVRISAQELKDEKMIKMPIYLANLVPWQDTVIKGIEKLKELERITVKHKANYIRPIMLIQAAQEQEDARRVYVGKIKDFLVGEAQVPAEQIAVQTGTTKELPDMDVLLSRQSPIRYIITVNALREGWDCPFAYILVSVSNLGARLSVEQTIGRIMRLPYAREYENPKLNSAYIFAATSNFSQASEAVIKGLHDNGYENIAASGGAVVLVTHTFKKVAKDRTAAVPYINIRDGKVFRRLDYVSDLLAREAILGAKFAMAIEFSPVRDADIEKIDISRDGNKLVRDKAGKLGMVYHYKDQTKEDLLSWLTIRVQRPFIGIEEMSKYLGRLLDGLVKKHGIATLSTGRYLLKEAIEQKLDKIVDGVADARFHTLLRGGSLVLDGESFELPKESELLDPCLEGFSRHFYEKAASMNKEELAFAKQIDALDSVAWWFRNPERDGFYIQGWLRHKFYPDFIAKTKKGVYFILEYKGEQLAGSEDTKYKDAIGRCWEGLGGGELHFALFGKFDVEKILKMVS